MALAAIKADNIVGLARYIVKTYSSGTDWYEVYNDGWVRQGGRLAMGSGSNITVTYLVPMKDSSYTPTSTVFSTLGSSGGLWKDININTFNSTSMTLWRDTTIGKTWVVEGYGASASVTSLGATPSY